eukprot:scaffold15380_cov19-Tisochrysis_lutea.AAC.1
MKLNAAFHWHRPACSTPDFTLLKLVTLKAVPTWDFRLAAGMPWREEKKWLFSSTCAPCVACPVQDDPTAKKYLHFRLVPVTFIYGKNDWMRPQHAVELCDELKKERQPRVSSDLHVSIIDEAGHFVFIDQPELFNKALIDACSMHMDKGTEQKASQAHGHAHATGHTATSTTFEHCNEQS